MTRNPRNYPDTMISAEAGRPMTRGEKLKTIKIDGKRFSYMQPGWWCSLTDPDDMEGQLVDEDNKIADMALRTAKALAGGETLFVPVVIRAIRESLGLTQREAGLLFGAGEKSFEKYESGEIMPSGPTKQLLALAIDHPHLFRKLADDKLAIPTRREAELVRKALVAGHVDNIYQPMFETRETQ